MEVRSMINDYEATQPMTTDAVPVEPMQHMTNDDVVATLGGLIQTCVDGEEGFRTAAEAIAASDTKTFLYENSQERARFAGELETLVRELGGDPSHSGSFTGAIHRGWMDLKTAIVGNDAHDILSECERGEDSAKKTFRDALDQTLPANVRSIVQRQCDVVVRSHDRVKGMRDSSGKDTANSAGGVF